MIKILVYLHWFRAKNWKKKWKTEIFIFNILVLKFSKTMYFYLYRKTHQFWTKFNLLNFSKAYLCINIYYRFEDLLTWFSKFSILERFSRWEWKFGSDFNLTPRNSYAINPTVTSSGTPSDIDNDSKPELALNLKVNF